MKKLFILRHAEAENNIASDDFARSLTAKGTEDARALGHYMRAHGMIPDKVLCSPATRTKATLQAIMEASGPVEAEYPKALYNASAGDIHSLIRQSGGNTQNLLIIAHNPGVYEFVRTMAGSFEAGLSGALMNGYASGTIATLDGADEPWGDLYPGTFRLSGYYPPSHYASAAMSAVE
jgi:phosphohistidine phosphatase